MYACTYILRKISRTIYTKILFIIFACIIKHFKFSFCFSTMNPYTCLFTLRKYHIYCLTCHNTDSELILELELEIQKFYLEETLDTISVLFIFQVGKQAQ